MKKFIYIVAIAVLSGPLLAVPRILKKLIQIPTHQNLFKSEVYLRQVIYNYGENMSYEGFVV
jgi:hypothetical protein